MGGHHIEVLERRGMDEGRDRCRLEAETQGRLEEVRHARLEPARLLAEKVLAGIALRIEIDDQGAHALAGADRRQVAYDGRFTHATLLIEDDTPHLVCPFLRELAKTCERHSLPWRHPS